jgi:hypothetical protein
MDRATIGYTADVRHLITLVLATLVLAGCAGSDSEADDPTTTSTTSTTETTTTTEPSTTSSEPPATTAPEDEGVEPIADASTETRWSDDFPTAGTEVALLTDVRTGRHDGFERIVFEFDGDAAPSYRLGYVDPPIRQAGSGNVVEVAGAAYLQVQLQPASGVDLSGPEYRETYLGPDRLELAAQGPARELVLTGDYEANMGWVLGTERRAPFAMAFLKDPLRLVVDVLDEPAGP